ncbi:hypothetical protein [Exiguobacterium sp. s191]|uniref:hypothetical protein n=1 Tax=Exiguobacterium sp. s191 TaxID=2751196 RepID=UPI001BED2684|nr:hypothetical protein [Exiguobacterium sp. s191]
MNTTFMKITVATIIAGSTLFSGTASAATKVETTATNQYTALKAGMTMEQVAKVLYGKDYKKQLTTKSGSQVLKTKEEFKDVEDKRKEIYYEIYDRKAKIPPTLMSLGFMTKKNDSVYRLISKQVEMGRNTYSEYRESTRKLNAGAKIKTGMTEKQLDGVLSGSGLGEWAGLLEEDARSVFSAKEIKAYEIEAFKGKLYVFQKSTKSRVYVEMSYDAKKKIYVIENHETF